MGSRPLVLGLLVVAAGCAGLVGSGGPPPTVSPAPLPTDTSTATGIAVPGLGPRGVSNATALSIAHERALGNTSFTRRITLSIRYPNGSLLLDADRTLRMDASGERFAYRERRTGAWARRPGDPVSISVWSTGGPVNRLVEFRNGTIRREAGLDRPTTIGRPVGDHVHTVFSGFDVDVIDRGDANGTTRFVLEATDVSSTVLPLFPAPHGTADIRAVVSESGLVRTIQVEAVSRRGRLTLHLIWTVRYSAVGETVITPPRLNDTAEDGP